MGISLPEVCSLRSAKHFFGLFLIALGMFYTGRERKQHKEGQDEGHEDAEHKSHRATRARNVINLTATCAGAFTQRLMQSVESP